MLGMANLPRESILHFLKGLASEYSPTTLFFSEAVSINVDLRIDGDDGGDFLDEIGRRFGTRFDGLYMPAYFHLNVELVGDSLPRMFGVKNKKKPLTIGHLADVIQKGAWFEP